MAGYLGHNPETKLKLGIPAVDEFTTSSAQASSGNFTLSQTVTNSKTLEIKNVQSAGLPDHGLCSSSL